MKAVTISIILLAAAITLRAQDATTVIAKVGDTELKAKDLAPYLASLSADDRAALTKNPALLNQVVRSLILQQVLLKEALSANWDKRPEVVEQLERLRKNAIAEDYLVTVAKVPDNYPAKPNSRPPTKPARISCSCRSNTSSPRSSSEPMTPTPRPTSTP